MSNRARRFEQHHFWGLIDFPYMPILTLHFVSLYMYDGKYERIDQYSDFFHVEQQNRNSSTYTSLQHPTTVLLSHMYHICTQQLFKSHFYIFLQLYIYSNLFGLTSHAISPVSICSKNIRSVNSSNFSIHFAASNCSNSFF